MKPALLAVFILLAAAPARAQTDVKIVEALAYVRDAPDGGAMWEYVKKDPIPIVFVRLLPGVDGRYMRAGDGRGWVELNERLRAEPGPKVGRVLYHQYLHRLQDRAPEVVTAGDMDTRDGYAIAMRQLREEIRPGGAYPDAPPEVRREFGVKVFFGESRRGRRPRFTLTISSN